MIRSGRRAILAGPRATGGPVRSAQWCPPSGGQWRALVCLALLGGGGLAGSAARAEEEELFFEDEIILKEVNPIVGVAIKEDTWRKVVGRREMGEVKVASHEVMEVVYADAPRQFSRGLRRVQLGYYTKAIEDSFLPTMKKLSRFRKVGGRPWPEQYCLYYLGLAHLRRGDAAKGDPSEAREYFQKLIKNIPDARFVFGAYMGVGETWQAESRYEEAAGAYREAQERFESMSRGGDLDAEQVKHIRRYARLAELRQIEMIDAQKKWDLASSAYERLVSRSGDFPEIQVTAKVGAVRSLVSLKSYDIAIRKCKAMIESGEREGQTLYLGGAYLALADCYFEKAGEKAALEDLVVARWNYLRVATLYFMDEKLLPKAYFRAGRCHEKLAKKEGARALARARRDYRLVVGRFPESPWAGEAKRRIEALGG